MDTPFGPSINHLVVDSSSESEDEYCDWPPKNYNPKDEDVNLDLIDDIVVKKSRHKCTCKCTCGPKRKKRDNDLVAKFVEDSTASAFFYTGLKEEHRNILWDFLGDAKTNLTIFKTNRKSSELRSLSVKSQFLLTLLILRRDRKFSDCAFHFKIGKVLVGRVFKTWIQFMYQKFKDIKDIMFVKKKDIKKPLPVHFQNPLCRDVRVVIDCTEIFIENASDFKEQGHKFSHYKHQATVKILIGVAPSGACSFVSDCFEGSISDVEIVEQSGFYNYIESGDLVLADRGFTIANQLALKGARLNMPAFLRGRKKFTLDESQTTKIIAKARIHIERFNQVFKRFEFVSGRVSQKHIPILSQAVYVCCCLANFTPRLAN